MTSLLLVLNNFIQNLFTTKSSECKSAFLVGRVQNHITKLVYIYTLILQYDVFVAILPTLPKKERLTASVITLTCFELEK